MNAKLVVVGGDAKAAEIKLKLPTVIGRGRDASLTLPHPLVSRQHCEIFESEGQLRVRDLGSLNGTYINNRRITEAVLPSGDLLTIGTVTFRAVYSSNADPLPPVKTSPAESASAAANQTLSKPKDVTLPEIPPAQDIDIDDEDEAVAPDDIEAELPLGESYDIEPLSADASSGDGKIEEFVAIEQFREIEVEEMNDLEEMEQAVNNSDPAVDDAPVEQREIGAAEQSGDDDALNSFFQGLR